MAPCRPHQLRRFGAHSVDAERRPPPRPTGTVRKVGAVGGSGGGGFFGFVGARSELLDSGLGDTPFGNSASEGIILPHVGGLGFGDGSSDEDISCNNSRSAALGMHGLTI